MLKNYVNETSHCSSHVAYMGNELLPMYSIYTAAWVLKNLMPRGGDRSELSVRFLAEPLINMNVSQDSQTHT